MQIFITSGAGYVGNPTILSAEEVLKGCATSFDSYGYCVIENIIPNKRY